MDNELTCFGALSKREPTVIFIPGAMTAPAVYAGIANELPCQSAIIDWNNSAGPWEIGEIASKVLRFIKERELGPTVLCGYSFGGVISMSAAIQDREGLVKGLMLADTGACAKGHGDPNFPETLKATWPDEAVFKSFLKRCFAYPISKGLYLQLWDYAKKLSRETVYQAAKSVRTVDLRDELKNISCPVLLIHGRRDTSRSEKHAREIIDGVKNSRLIMFDCGHTPSIEEHDKYVGVLLDFIKELGIADPNGLNALSTDMNV